VLVWRCHQDVSPCFHCLSPGLLCSAFWHHEMFCRLHSAQNAAARLVTGSKRSDHISPVPVRQPVVFKIATLVYRSLSGHAPGYLTDNCQLDTGARADNCVPPTRGRWLSTEHPAVSETGLLQVLPQEFGTVCRKTHEKPTYHTPGWGGRQRRILNFLTAPCM